MERQIIGNFQQGVADCERRKIFQYLNQWLQYQDTERPLTMNEK